jgi:predicted transcriptional regulator
VARRLVMSRATHNFHLPLPEEVHEMLREEAERSGQPATTVAREALQDWLRRRRRERRHAEIVQFASANAGSALDLDPELEQAGLEAIECGD